MSMNSQYPESGRKSFVHPYNYLQPFTPVSSPRDNHPHPHQFHDVFTPTSPLNSPSYLSPPYEPPTQDNTSNGRDYPLCRLTANATPAPAGVPPTPISSPLVSVLPAIPTNDPQSIQKENLIQQRLSDEEEIVKKMNEDLEAAAWPCQPGDTFQCPFEYYESLLEHATRHGFTIARSFERYNVTDQAKFKVVVKKGYIYCNVLKSKNGRRGCCFCVRFVHTKIGHYRINKCNTGHLHCLSDSGGRRRAPVCNVVTDNSA